MRMLHQISGNTTQDMIRKQYILCITEVEQAGTRWAKDHKCNSIEEQHTASVSKEVKKSKA